MNQYLTNMQKVHYWRNYTPSQKEVSDPISKTMQGQSYSVKDALERVQRGLPVDTGRKYAWSEDGDESVPMRMKDLTDLDNAKNQLEFIKDEQKKRQKEKEVKKEESA